MPELNLKEVRFDVWCPKCRYYETNEVEDPCNWCLSQGWNVDSTKPINFVENEDAR